MSLINEALKKAQRVRHEDVPAPEESAAPAGGTRIVRRGRAHSANTMILLASGGVVLVVLSVVVTFFLVNHTPEPAPKAAVAPTTTAQPAAPAPLPAVAVPPKTETAAPPVAVILPVIAAPVEPAPAPAPVTVATTNPPATALSPAVAAPPAQPDERVSLFVESIKVAGVRSSGNDSRVLMNERVYRVNDLVERTLGLKLVGVAANTLTFSDSSGATYVKHF